MQLDISVEEKIGFIRDLYSPMTHQLDFHEKSHGYKDRLLLGARASGKTQMALAEAIWRSRCVPENNGIYITQNVSHILRDIEVLTPPNWIKGVYGGRGHGGHAAVTLHSVQGSLSYISLFDNHDPYNIRKLEAMNIGWYVVDEVAWNLDFHNLINQRMKRSGIPRQGLYIYSGCGFPQFFRDLGCNNNFYKGFWGEDYFGCTMADRAWGNVSPQALGTGGQLSREELQRVTEEIKTTPPVNAEQMRDDGIDDFIAEIDTMLNEPDDPVIDGEIPKAAPTDH